MAAGASGGPGGESFVADVMLGRLSRWMRVLGYDVEYDTSADDKAIIRKAVTEGRIILTRDTLLVKRRAARGRFLFVEGNHIEEQINQIVKSFPHPIRSFLSRCLRCNVELEGVEKSAVKNKVPPYVYNTQEEFSVCRVCGRVYWAGTHREKMVKELSRILGRDFKDDMKGI